MKTLKTITATILLAAFVTAPFAGLAAEAKAEKPKPYPLKTCLVSDEKLGGMGAPYVFTHEGQEIKLCCKSCLKDFKKDPAKYLKKLKDTPAKAAESK
jgi:YHS domain-containing protein